MRLYFSRAEQIAVAMLLLAILAGMGVWGWNRTRTTRMPRAHAAPVFQPGPLPRAAVDAPPSVTTDVVVHVTGAVKQPGLYTLPAGARFHDAIRRAGGAKADGYPDALNLAAHLEDGIRIYVPTKAEWQQMTADTAPALVTPSPRETGASTPGTARTQPHPALVTSGPAPSRPTTTAPAATATSGSAALPSGPKPLPVAPVALNSATKEQLMTLPGIGPSTAEAILAYRREHGPFNDIAEVQNVPRIGPKTLEKLRPYITL